MRGDEVHRRLLEVGWCWDRCEEYRRTVDGVTIVLIPNVREFPAQRHVPWTIYVEVKHGSGKVQNMIGVAKEFKELVIFTR